MQIIAFARSDEHHSVGTAAGEGLLYGLLVKNSDGSIELCLRRSTANGRLILQQRQFS
jgi:hypothetical protein